MDVNDDACLEKSAAFKCIASELAPTGGEYQSNCARIQA
ncbi:hypothetical protein AN403_3331 [Pseudomonas fluorescens]|uniref:Uncharacterized protein n=1 Tax=Pseudomonas fluorescens TaxID=294 RepID=A0A0P8ZQL1_PSEFL|nr:hypothetical protein AN403_3331 [Pseudomonas fluorescens]